jgi:hypothetical protein
VADEKELRAEIVDAEKARVDFQKWKLVLVAGLGAAGLGLGAPPGTTSHPQLLCVIPLVCGYVDLLCKHITLRIMVIGTYVRKLNEGSRALGTVLDYEGFVEKTRKKVQPFELEDWVMDGSTLVLSAAIAGYGLWAWRKSQFLSVDVWPYLVSGILGLVMFCIVRFVGNSKLRRLAKIDLKPEKAVYSAHKPE